MLHFVGDGDQKKIHQKSPLFFNAKFPGKLMFLESSQSNNLANCLFSLGVTHIFGLKSPCVPRVQGINFGRLICQGKSFQNAHLGSPE